MQGLQLSETRATLDLWTLSDFKCHSSILGQSATGIQRLDGCQHGWADAIEPQAAPQERMLDCDIRLLMVHKADMEGSAGDEGTMNAMPEGKEVMDG